jgi:membrane associated rhomboid family serine protease
MPEGEQTCYRHKDRRAGVRCQRCERPICPSCMVGASVGFHCPECARTGRQKVLTARSLVTRPIVTQVLIGINAAVFVAELASGSNTVSGGGGDFVDRYSLFAGAVAAGDWWRIVTSGFIHFGLLHLGMNMFALWILGQQMEQALGRLRFSVLYFVALLAGALGVLLISPNELTGGASGAIFGLLGAAIAGQRAQGRSIWDSGLGGVLLLNLGFTFLVPHISIGGHLGGLAGGYLVGVMFFDLGPRSKSPGLAIGAAVALGVACTVGALIVASNPLT